MSRTAARAALCALALLPLAACSSVREPEPDWIAGQVDAISRDVLWNQTQLALKLRGYPRGLEVDPNDLTMESGWRLQLQPWRGKGTRQKAIVRLTPVEGTRWSLEVRVKTQANMAIVRPLDPSYAEWEWRDDDTAEAQVLLQTIRSSLVTPAAEPAPGR